MLYIPGDIAASFLNLTLIDVWSRVRPASRVSLISKVFDEAESSYAGISASTVYLTFSPFVTLVLSEVLVIPMLLCLALKETFGSE